jgi:hypothetical protein
MTDVQLFLHPDPRIAELQADNVQLRAALVGLTKEPCQCFAGCEECVNEPNWYDLAEKALSQPTDTTALQAAIDAAYERAAVVAESVGSNFDGRIENAIRALKKGTS